MTPGVAALIIPAFVAGMLTFLAPCTLPLVPAYLGFISGVSTRELKDLSQAKRARRKIFLNGLLFMLGFTVIFVSFGVSAGFLGQALAPFRVWLTRIGGVIVILFGLALLGIGKNSSVSSLLGKELHPKLKPAQTGNPLGSALLGGAFAFGWTPCVGPILGSILLFTASSATALSGGFLLLIFSAGLAVPFLLVALGIGSAGKIIQSISPFLPWIERGAGVLLILLGWLLVTGNFGLLVIYGYRLLEFINYDRLLDYL